MAADPRINGDRLWSGIMETARFGATPNGGIKRLTLTKEDAVVRQWFKERTETLGCKVIVGVFPRRASLAFVDRISSSLPRGGGPLLRTTGFVQVGFVTA
jgi:hypothetical protein